MEELLMMNPFFPMNDLFSFQKVMVEKMIKTNKNFLKAINMLTRDQEVEVGTTPSDVAFKIHNIKLLHYKPLTETQEPIPILIIYALINKPYILDLQPDRSVVKVLLENGFDVYLIDWDEPREKDHMWDLDLYVNNFIDRIVDFVREDTDSDQITILGYCMGGTLSTMYTALYPEKVKNFMAMAAPIYFDTKESLLHVWAVPEYFDVDRVVDTLGNIPAEFLNGGYGYLDPIGNMYSKYIKFVDNVDNENFVKMFLRMEKWLNDGIPLAGETFREFIKYGYQQNLLVKNEWRLDGQKINLKNIDMPILNIVGLYDNLVPPSASKPLLDYVSSTDKKEFLQPTGHIGLSVSSKSHRELWPKVVEWLKPRSQESSDSDAEDTDATSTSKSSTSKGKGRGGGRGKGKGKSKGRGKGGGRGKGKKK
jgi:polyhydroxyalkanoate synthase